MAGQSDPAVSRAEHLKGQSSPAVSGADTAEGEGTLLSSIVVYQTAATAKARIGVFRMVLEP